MNAPTSPAKKVEALDQVNPTTVWKDRIKYLKQSLKNTMRSLTNADRLLLKTEKNLGLKELLEEFEKYSKPDAQKALEYADYLYAKLPKEANFNCKLNKLLLKARVEISNFDHETENINLIALNSLHLIGTQITFDEKISYEMKLLQNGIVISGISGAKVRVSILNGTFLCPINQIKIIYNEGALFLRLKTNNPMSSSSSKLSSSILLESKISRTCSNGQDNFVVKVKEKAKSVKNPRKTYSNMDAFNYKSPSQLSIVIPRLKDLLTVANLESVTETYLNMGVLKKVFTVYAFLTLLASGIVCVFGQVPQYISISMAFCAVSLFLLGLESKWSKLSTGAAIVNLVAMGILVISLVYLH